MKSWIMKCIIICNYMSEIDEELNIKISGSNINKRLDTTYLDVTISSEGTNGDRN